MDLKISFVWIGPKKFGWLECFMVYAWRMWGCEVNVHTHRGPDQSPHDHKSLGLPPNVCNIVDLQKMIAADELSDNAELVLVKRMRSVLIAWYSNRIKEWGMGGQQQIYNMVDMTKSYLACTRQGVVLDMKIGPSQHLKTYVDAGVFEKHFVSYKRGGAAVENQCMGSMKADSTFRAAYAKRFEQRTLAEVEDLKSKPEDIHFNFITGSHMQCCTLGGRNIKYLDIGVYGKSQHEKLHRIFNADVQGIAGEKYYGPLRIFKKESDQTNTSAGGGTTQEEQKEMRDLTFRELADASIGDGGVDVTAVGMPPVEDMLDLLKLTD